MAASRDEMGVRLGLDGVVPGAAPRPPWQAYTDTVRQAGGAVPASTPAMPGLADYAPRPAAPLQPPQQSTSQPQGFGAELAAARERYVSMLSPELQERYRAQAQGQPAQALQVAEPGPMATVTEKAQEIPAPGVPGAMADPVPQPLPPQAPDEGLARRDGESVDQYGERLRSRGMGDLQAGWETGVKSLGQLAGGAGAALGSVLPDWAGGEALQQWGTDLYRRKEAEMAPLQEGRTTRLEDIGSLGEAVDWAQFTLGQVAPSILESVGMAALGAVAGGASAGPGGSLLGGLAGAVAKAPVKRFLAEQVAGHMAKGAAKEFAEAAAQKTLARHVGAGAALFASSYVQGVGDVYGETMDEQGRGSAMSAFLGGLPYAALDTVTDLSIFKSVLRGSDGERALARYAQAMLTGAAKEGGAESGQEALLLLAGAANGKEYDSHEVLSRLGNSFAAGALAGGVMGVGGGREGPSEASREQATLGNLAAVGLAGRAELGGLPVSQLSQVLSDPAADVNLRADAIAQVELALRERVPDLADLWVERAGAALQAKAPIAVPAVLDDTRAGGRDGYGQGAEGQNRVPQGQEAAEAGAQAAGGGGLGANATGESAPVGSGAASNVERTVRDTAAGAVPRDTSPEAIAARTYPAAGEIAWGEQPLAAELIPGRGGEWTRELYRSQNGAWALERAINPDGEIARERVVLFSDLAKQRVGELDAAYHQQVADAGDGNADPGAQERPTALAAERERWRNLVTEAAPPVVPQPPGRSPEAQKIADAHAKKLLGALQGKGKLRGKYKAELAWLREQQQAGRDLSGIAQVAQALEELHARDGSQGVESGVAAGAAGEAPVHVAETSAAGPLEAGIPALAGAAGTAVEVPQPDGGQTASVGPGNGSVAAEAAGTTQTASEVANAGSVGQGAGQEPAAQGNQPEAGQTGARARGRGEASTKPAAGRPGQAGSATGIYPVDMPSAPATGFRPGARVRGDDGAPGQVEQAAAQAATSPANDLPEPTPAQKEAGNYQKGHVRLDGHEISIENPAGSRRRPEWPALAQHYGYFKGSLGRDKDHVDVFLGPKAEAPSNYYVIDQIDPKSGRFDEHKVMMGFPHERAARAAYRANYAPDWKGLGAITRMSPEEFRAWVRDPERTKRAVAYGRTGQESQAATPTAIPGGKESFPGGKETQAPESAVAARAVVKGQTYQKNSTIKRTGKPGGSRAVVESVEDGKVTYRHTQYLNSKGQWQQDGDGYRKTVPLEQFLKAGWGAVSDETTRGPGPEPAAAGPERPAGATEGGAASVAPAPPVAPAGTGPDARLQPGVRAGVSGAQAAETGGVTVSTTAEPVAAQSAPPTEPQSKTWYEQDEEIRAARESQSREAIVNQAMDEELDALFGAQKPATPAAATQAERAVEQAPTPPRTAGQAGASAVKNLAMGLDEVASGLVALFGGPGRVGSGPVFDEATYAKAKPLFVAGVAHFKTAAADIGEMVKALVRALVKDHGLTRETVEAMRPYIQRFVADVESGAVESAGAVAQTEPEVGDQVTLIGKHPRAGATGVVRYVSNMTAVNLREGFTEPTVTMYDIALDGGESVSVDAKYVQRGPAKPDAGATIKLEGIQGGDDEQATGATDQGGKRPDRGNRDGDRRPEGARDDRPVAADSPTDGGAPGATGDSGGVRPSAEPETERGGGRLPEGGDGLAGQPGGGQQGLADQRPAGGRGGRAGGGRGAAIAPGDGGARAGAAVGAGGGQPDTGGAAEGVTPAEPSQAQDLAARAENFYADDPARIYGGTPKARFNKNRRAIEIYRELEEAGRPATAEEREVLAGYTGWGSFGQDLFQGTWERAIYKDGWREENDWLRAHLGESEWKAAQASIINAHYTDPPTVQAIWAAVGRLGFQGGRVLEPAAGIGNFFAMMPKSAQDASQLTGIELDELSAGILKHLYPAANIQQKPYQDSKTPDGFYDLVIGNWPFASTGPADRRYNKLSPSLHDYFFLKGLDQVRAGGLVVGITSRYSLDGVSRAVRLELAKKADLVAAYRLPSGAFEEYAGTKVVTDLIILKKRASEHPNPQEVAWVDVAEMELGPDGEKAKINRYYHDNPGNVLGTLGWGSGTTYGRAGVTVERPADLAEQLKAIADELPAGLYEPARQTRHIRYLTNNTQDRTKSVVVGPDGGLYQVQGEQLADLHDVYKWRTKNAKETAKREAQLRALVEMRRAYGRLIDAERDGAADTEDLRRILREQYEAFRAEHGPLQQAHGLKVLRYVEDPFYPALAGLEREKDGAYEPMAILSRPVMRKAKRLDSPTVREAYVMARNQGMVIDLEAVAQAAKVTVEDAERELVGAGAMFQLPSGGYEPADVYLGGNVRRKLAEAKAAREQGVEGLDRNIAALEKAIPATVPYFNIEAKLGAQWVAPKWYRAFVAEVLLGDAAAAEDLTVEWRVNRWVVDAPDRLRGTPAAMRWREVTAYEERTQHTFGQGVETVLDEDGKPVMNQVDSGTVPFRQLVEAAFNNGTMRFTEKDSDGNVFVREAFSAAANERATAIREAFEEWVWKAPERKVALERDYNEVMNAVADPSFDGSFLSFDGMALQRGESQFGLRQHQVNAIWRALVQGSGLYAHEVGTGKTYTMGGIAVESRRFGLARKPLILAHNANSASVAAEMQEMYPGAKVLYVNNLDPSRVKQTLQQIRNDDWDAVVVPHSLLDRLTLKRETLDALAAEEIAALEAAFWEAIDEADGRGEAALGFGQNRDAFDLDDEDAIKKMRNPTAKELAQARIRIKKMIEKQAQDASREDAIAFEDLGVDMILVDEAHLFKKPPLATRMKMRGLQKQISNRSVALKFLADYIKGQNAGRGVHLFTGTPITNTLAEIFHMQRYVMQGDMRRDGINEWDLWFNTFATGVSDVEFTAAGDYQPVTKLAGFINVAELRRMMGPYMDVVFADDMPEFKPRETNSGKTLASDDLTAAEREELLNGRQEDPVGRPYKKVVMDVAEMSPHQEAILMRLQRLSNEWRSAGGKQRLEWMKGGDEHSPILIEGAAARAGMDARMEDLSLPEYEDSKVNRAVRNIMRHYVTEPDAAQVVFMDKGYSDTRTVHKVKIPGLNLAKELREKLIAAGVPAQEIAIVAGGVTPEQKKAVADAVSAGRVRVVIGQTETLGTGVNMQTRLRAMHHLDAPWMPGELEQRNGRGWRQGNTWNTVLEYRYITERIDGKRWQVLAVKDRFIKAFLHADENVRVIEGDAVSDDEGGYAETLSEAVGDPRLLLRQKLKADVEKLQRKERVHAQGLVEAREQLARNERAIPHKERLAEVYQADAEAFTRAQERADQAQQEAYRDAVAAYVDGLGLKLSPDERAAVRADGWGTKQNDRELAKRVREAVKQAEAEGNERPKEPTTRPFEARLLRETFTSREPFTEALKTLWQRMPQAAGWHEVGEVFGFTLAAKKAGRDAVWLELVSPTDGKERFTVYGPNAASIGETLRSLRGWADKARQEAARMRADQESLEQVAAAPFARQKDLDRKQKRLEEIEADMARNPVPAPAWLRHGAPLDAEVFLDGKPVVVEGHQWADDGYFVYVSDGDQSRRVPYLDLRDGNRARLFEPAVFESPASKSGKPTAGIWVVTTPEGKDQEPRWVSDEHIAQLLSHGYSLRPAEPKDWPVDVAADAAAREMDWEGGGQGVRFALGGGGAGAPMGQHYLVRQRTTAGGGEVLKAAFLQGRIDSLTRAWKGLRGVPVRVVQRERDLPAVALTELARVRRSNSTVFPKAVFVPGPGRGEIVLVADNLRDVRDAVTRVLHEAVGHLGVTETFGPTFEGFLDELIAQRSADVALYARRYGLDMERLADRRVAAEELLAHMAEAQAEADLPFLRRVYQAIRAWLRAQGFTLRLTEGDLREILAGARRYIERGDARAALRVRERFGVPGGERSAGARLAGGLDPNRQVVVTDLRGDEIAAGPLTWKQAAEYARTHFRRNHYLNQDTGAPIEVVAKGVDEAAHYSKTQADLQSFAAIPQLIERAVLVASEPDKLGRYGIRAVDTFYAPIRVAGELRRAKLTVRETIQGGKYYGHRLEALEIEEPGVSGVEGQAAAAVSAIATRQPGSTMSLADLLAGRQDGGSRFALATPEEHLAEMRAQADYLTEQAKAKGYRDLDTFAQGDTDAFVAAALDWRNRHPTAGGYRGEGAGPAVRFALASDLDAGASPVGGGARLWESIKDVVAGTGEWAGDRWRQALPQTLGAVTLRQLADLGAKHIPGIVGYTAEQQRMDTRRNAMVEESGVFASDVWESWARKRENRPEADEVARLMHDSTLAQVDPSDYKVLTVALQLGPGELFWRNREATKEAVQELVRQARAMVKSGKREDRGMAGYYILAAKQLRGAVRAEAARRKALPELQRRWAALSPEAQAIYRQARDLYKKRSEDMMAALIARVRESEALDEATKTKLAKQIRAEFEQTVDEKGNPRIGPYFPLQRFGRFYAFARRFPTGAARTFRKLDGQPFESASSARGAIGRRSDLKGIEAKPVELPDKSGWVLEELGEPWFGMFESIRERKRAVAELEAEGWSVVRQGLTQEARKDIEGVSEGFMAEAVAKLKARGAEDEADMLYQMYLNTLHQMSIRKHFVHRKGTAGFSNDALRAFGWNMMRLAHQVAKLEHVPRLERLLREIEDEKKAAVEGLPKRDATVADAFLQELHKRHQWIVSPDNAAWTNFTAGLGFAWYLGVTPGAALVNLTQTPILALPVLAAKFGWKGASKALGSAFLDVTRGFKPVVVKGFLTGRPMPSQAANLSDEEREAFAAWDLSGVRDRTRAHNLAGIGDTDTFWNGPTFNRGMAIISSGFHAAEVLNRDTTLLAAYRLARAQGKSHQQAVAMADEATWEAHFDYSNANRAGWMQSNAAKALLMFRSYGQHVMYFLWRNLYQSLKGESADVRHEARTKFLGLMGMTGLFAGTLGLPMLGAVFTMANLAAAAFGDDDEPWDAEIEFRNWLARTFPDTVADVLDRGAVTTFTGLDWASRVSLRELFWRSPDRDLDGAGTYQHITEQLMGPLGGIAGSPFTAFDLLQEGHWERAAEAVAPKFLKDALRAGRFAAEGVLTKKGVPVVEDVSGYEVLWKALGMNPERLAVRQDANAAVKVYEGRIKDRRSRLMTAYALATMHGDQEAQAGLLPQIRAFNEAQPALPITARGIRTSVRNRERSAEQAAETHGMVVNRRLAPEVVGAGGFGE